MGTFAMLSGIIGKSQVEVVTSLNNYVTAVSGGLQQEHLDLNHDNLCVIEQTNGNTTIYYPHGYVEWDESSAFMSKELNAPVFSFHIHDGDLWMYTFYVNGEIVDQFNPIPDYWDEEISEEEINSWKGNAVTVAQYIPGLDAKEIGNYLVRWDPEGDGEDQKAYDTDTCGREEWQLIDFMKKLGLPYPLENIDNITGQIYKLWTKQLRLQPQAPRTTAAPPATGPTSSARPATDPTAPRPASSPPIPQPPKPWWKFW